MKKVTLVLIVTVLLAMLVSCGEDVVPQTNRLDELKLQYDPVGEGHNDALDELYRIYAEKKVSENKCLSYSDCIGICDEHFGSSDIHNIAGEITALLHQRGVLTKTSINAEIVDVLSDSLEIMAKYPEIFDSISVILDAGTGIGTKTGELENMYLFADEHVEDVKDKEAIMNGISTTIHSLEYWENNMNDWQETLGGGMPKPAMGLVGAIGLIDAAGAVIGTLEGIRDTYKGQDGRLEIIIGRAVGEGAKTSAYAILAIVMI